MQFGKSKVLFCLIVLSFSIFLLFGCTSTTSICGDSVCSSDEAINCTCLSDCGACENMPGGDINSTIISTIPLSAPVSSSVTEIDISPLISNVNLSSLIIPSIDVSGSVVLPSKEDYLRVILLDSKGKEHLVFEAYYPLYSLGTFSFENICNETCDLSKITPSKIRIETNISDFSKIQISSLSISSGAKLSQKDTAVNSINKNLRENNESWVAGETSVSKLSYAEKKAMFGDGSVAPQGGFEYYSGGVFGSASLMQTQSTPSTNLPSSWDWRNRNGKNYISPIKNQGTYNLCWAFASVAAVESVFNIYYNDLLNYDLAEKEYFCGTFNNLSLIPNTWSSGSGVYGGYIYQGIGYLSTFGVVEESCIPYTLNSSNNLIESSCTLAASVDCTNYTFTNGVCAYGDTACASCKNKSLSQGNSACASKKIFSISDFNYVGADYLSVVTDLNVLKRTLIEKGPLAMGSDFFNVTNYDKNITSGHAMLLVGYETDSQGRTILIFKNSYGVNWGVNGYAKTYVPEMSQVFYVFNPTIKSNGTNPVVNCVDEDNDSYCSWGIGSKPSSCSSSCNSLEDCDDSNPGLRAFDSNYNCVNVSSGKIQITSSPSDANVYFNSIYKGITPLTLDLNAGSYSYVIKKEDFSTQSNSIIVNFNETKTLDVSLLRDPKVIWKNTDFLPTTSSTVNYTTGNYLHSRMLIDNITSDSNKISFSFKGVQQRASYDTKTSYEITAAYICEKGENTKCVAGTQKQIKFSDLNTARVQDKGNLVSDYLDYNLSKSKKYFVLLFTDDGIYSLKDSTGLERASIDDYKSFLISLGYYSKPVKIQDYLTYDDTRSFVTAVYGLEKLISFNSPAVCGNLECESNENYSSCPNDCIYVAPVIAFTDSAKAEYDEYVLKSASQNYKIDYNYYSASTTSYYPPSQYLQPSTSITDGNTTTFKYLTKTRTDSNYLSNASSSPSTSFSISVFDADTNKSFSCSRMVSAAYTNNWSCTCNSASSGGAASEIKVAKLDSEIILGQNVDCFMWRTLVQPSGQDSNYIQCFNSKGITLKNEIVSTSSSVSTSMTVNTNLSSISKAINLVESSSISQIIPRIGTEGEKIFTCMSLATECVPGQTDLNKTGSNVGICKERIVNKVCDSGFWTQTITQEGVSPSTEVCDVNVFDEDCDGTANEACSCINGAQADCTLSDLCKLGKTTCSSGVWGTCTEVGTKTVNSSCGVGKACSNLGVCTTIACASDSVCPNTTGKVCKSAKCLSPGDYNSSCTIQNLPFGTSCGTSLSCDNLGECAAYPCTVNSDCVTANSCQTGICQSSVCNFVNKAENTDCNTGKKCNSNGQCTSVTCDSNSQCTSTNACQTGTCNNAGLWNSSCTFENKIQNTSCGASNVCDTNGLCVSPICSVTNACTSSNPCKDASCTSAGNWNASCLLTNKVVNSVCGTTQKCNAIGECKTIACTVDTNCISSNICQVGVCYSSGDYNATCSYSNKADNSSCGSSNSCISGICQKYSKVIYNSTTFNGASAPATLTVDNNLSIDRNFVGSKEVLISSSLEKAVSFNHDFSIGDLNLINTTVQKGNFDGNRNYLVVKGLVLQGTKTIYLPQSLSNNAVCVLDSEVNDVNSAKQACAKISCPGVSGNISCSIEGNLFAISGLTHSFVSEDYVYCGDGVCSTTESCSSCATDCNACAQTGSPSIICSTDAACGASSLIGSKFCVSNTVMQTYRDKNCFNKGTTSSRCVTTDLNKLISACSSSQICVNGECIASQVQPVVECTIDSNCLSSEECDGTECKTVVCSNGYVAQNHSCVCDGEKCGSSCYSETGICCSEEWKANKTTCVMDSNSIVVDDSNTPNKKPPVSEITLLGIPILYIGVGAIVFTVILILIFTFLPTKK